MAYQNGNYQFVVHNNWTPLTMQEVLTPFTMYKEAYDKDEERYLDLQNKADTFSYLAETLPEDSRARQIYEGYANDLRKYGDDFGANGLSMANRRGLLNMRRRYQGEIGRLEKADTELQKEIDRRVMLNANDPTTLYATDNLSIDDFLDRKEPNTYSISGDALYKRGLEIGASGSSRIYSSPQIQSLTKMYNDAIQTQGYSPELVARFRDNLATIPEFQKAVMATLKEKGVTDNLTGNNYQRAVESVVNGIVNGITYKRNDSISQNPDYITAYQRQQIAQAQDSLALQAAGAGMKKDANGNWVWDENIDPSFQKAKAVATIKGSGKGNGKGSGTQHNTIAKQATKISWNGDNPSDTNGDADDDYTVSTYSPDTKGQDHVGTITSYDNLPSYAKKQVDKVIKDGNYDYYDIYFRPYQYGIFDDDEATLDIVPRDIVTDDSDDVDASIFNMSGK